MNRDIERARALYKIASGPGALGMNPAQYRDFRARRRELGNLPPYTDMNGNPIPADPEARRKMSLSEAYQVNKGINDNQSAGPWYDPNVMYRSGGLAGQYGTAQLAAGSTTPVLDSVAKGGLVAGGLAGGSPPSAAVANTQIPGVLTGMARGAGKALGR